MAVYLIESNQYRDVTYPIFELIEITIDDPSIDLEELANKISIKNQAEVTVLEGNTLYIPVKDIKSKQEILNRLANKNIKYVVDTVNLDPENDYSEDDLSGICVYKINRNTQAVRLLKYSLRLIYKLNSHEYSRKQVLIPKYYIKQDNLYYYIKDNDLEKRVDKGDFNLFLDYFNIQFDILNPDDYNKLKDVI